MLHDFNFEKNSMIVEYDITHSVELSKADLILLVKIAKNQVDFYSAASEKLAKKLNFGKVSSLQTEFIADFLKMRKWDEFFPSKIDFGRLKK